MLNTIFLRRKNKLVLERGNEESPHTVYISTILKNVEDLGYTFSKDLLDILATYSKAQLAEFYFELITSLKVMVGAHRDYKPMYPNFPEQVMNAQDSELYFNAIIHYWSSGTLLPHYEKQNREPLTDVANHKVINIGTMDELKTIFTNLMKSKTSISDMDKSDLSWLFEQYRDVALGLVPNEIPLKENIAIIANLILTYTTDEKIVFTYFKTATDVLRLAVAMSDGDVSLAAPTKFRSFKRKERRLLLSLLSNCSSLDEDMVKYKNRWIRLGERLHPSEYKTAFLNAQQAFQKIRNNEKIETFNSKVTKAIHSEDYKTALALLKTRPGEFARKLDHLLRISTNSNVVLNEFKEVANEVSVPVLLQVKEHFKSRNAGNQLRAFFPKGNIAKVYGIVNMLPPIQPDICESVVKICNESMLIMFKNKEPLGKVYIDEKLKDYIVPFSQRSANKSLKTLTRGSKIDIPKDTHTIRSFVYWKEPQGDRTDIDLSAVMYDDNWEYVEHISYTNLISNTYNACHSGDIVSAPSGASEFIDLDINSIKGYGGRYIVLSLNLFTAQGFVDLPECFVGWMARKNPSSGEIFEPRTVQNKTDVAANTSICIPIILDLYEMKVIWTDIGLREMPHHSINVENNRKGMVLMGRAITSLAKPNLFDLFELHQQARGIKCDIIEEADVVFSLEAGITPFDIEIITSQYL
ncbi:TerD family protein [Paenibacillus sp. L3-i20]|uniref:TerD family protein n=1 Tax=Paenibacillus sp. L3-i20 TaxID=2905833 RepID=UPI001EDD907D|nr:TerD family protein [Paenibacillus sp. L3-i20]GKU78409.1 hypothetical protein L3i20_v228060 [Paenibacillus sp. L3-i20]